MADSGTHGGDPSTTRRLGRFFEEHRLVIQAGFDCLGWIVALPAALILRYEFEFSPKMWGPFKLGGLVVAISAACLLQFTIGLALGLYRGRWRYGSFDEIAHLARSAAVVDTRYRHNSTARNQPIGVRVRARAQPMGSYLGSYS